MGTPTPYKWIGTSAPDFTVAVCDDLSGTDWQQLVSPPPIPSTEPQGWDPDNEKTFPDDWLTENDFSQDRIWHGEANAGQYFLVRWIPNAKPVSDFRISLRPGILRGPVLVATDY